MWILLPLALLLACFALWAGLTSGPAPRLSPARVRPIIRAVAAVTAVGFAFGALIGFATAKRAQESGAYASLRDARQRLAEKPRDPELWKSKISAAEKEVARLESTPPPATLMLDPLLRMTSLTLVLSSLCAGLVLFRLRLDP